MINNMAYVYMVSTIFGGILYFIKQNVISKYLYSCLIIILLPLVSIEIIKYFNKIKSNYKYVIFKYKVYQEIEKGVYDEDNNLNFEYIQTDTKSYYYQAIPIDKFGETNFKIKYERG